MPAVADPVDVAAAAVIALAVPAADAILSHGLLDSYPKWNVDRRHDRRGERMVNDDDRLEREAAAAYDADRFAEAFGMYSQVLNPSPLA